MSYVAENPTISKIAELCDLNVHINLETDTLICHNIPRYTPINSDQFYYSLHAKAIFPTKDILDNMQKNLTKNQYTAATTKSSHVLEKEISIYKKLAHQYVQLIKKVRDGRSTTKKIYMKMD